MRFQKEFRGDLLVRLSNGRIAVAFMYLVGRIEQAQTDAALDLESFLLELGYKAWALQFVDWYEFAYHFQSAKRLRIPRKCTEDITYHWRAEYTPFTWVDLAAEVGVANQSLVNETRAKFRRPWLYFSGPVMVQDGQKPPKWAWVRIVTQARAQEGLKELLAKKLISYAETCYTKGQVFQLSQVDSQLAASGEYLRHTNPKTGVTTFQMVENRESLLIRLSPY